MTRLRYDGLTAYTVAPLNPGDTGIVFTAALTHDGGTPVPDLTPGDVIALSLLTTVSGTRELVEIVHLTDYTEGALTGTITRGMEGTPASTHPTGIRVISAPTVIDFLDLSSASTAHASALLVSKLQADQGDASLLYICDSSGAIEDIPWTQLIAVELGVMFPSYTVEFAQFNGNSPTPSPGSWDAPTTLQVGTGSNTLRVWNGSVGSTNTRYPMGQLAEMVIAPAPDLVMISHGANELVTSATHTPDDIRAAYLCLVGAIKQVVPNAGVACISQHPVGATGAADSYMVAEMIREACQATGADYYNMTQVFHDLGASISDYLADGTHCNQLGQDLWAATIWARAFNFSNPTPATQIPSSLGFPIGRDLLVNGRFTTYAPPAAPTGWLASNVTLAKDLVNFEALFGNAYSLKMTSTGAGVAVLQQALNAAVVERLKGKYVTLVARAQLVDPPAATVPIAQRGTVWLNDGVAPVLGIPDLWNDDIFVYHAVSLKVDAAAPSLTASLVCDFPGTNVGTVTLFDWAGMVEGLLPGWGV